MSGLILRGSPPSLANASLMTARSTTAGTPVKSCMMTRAGLKGISPVPEPGQRRMLSRCASVTALPSIVRATCSIMILMVSGSLARSAPALRAIRSRLR